MKDQAHVVIIGGGIYGVNIAYHLFKLGWRDIVLLEKGEIASGESSHAAGVSGVEARLALVHTFGVGAGRIDLCRWVEACCTLPAEVFGLGADQSLDAPGFVPPSNPLAALGQWFNPFGALYNLFYGLIIIFFTYFYTAVVLNPNDLAENMRIGLPKEYFAEGLNNQIAHAIEAAIKEYEMFGYVSASMAFMVLAHFLYVNACAKGEECIPTTWDMTYEKV